MARFFGSALEVIQRIYPLLEGGDKRVDRVDLGGPIQMVHDVSREVELGSAPGTGVLTASTNITSNGWLRTTHAVLPVADDTDEFASFSVPDKVIGTALGTTDVEQTAKYRAWLYNVSLRMNTSLVLHQALVIEDSGAVRTDSIGAGPGAESRAIIGVFNTQTLPVLAAASMRGGLLSSALTGNYFNPSLFYLPRLVTGQVDLAWQVNSGTAADRWIVFQFLWWVGPLGVTPPGLR